MIAAAIVAIAGAVLVLGKRMLNGPAYYYDRCVHHRHPHHSLPSTLEGPVFVLPGIEFVQIVNSGFYPLKNTGSNAMAIKSVGSIGAVPS